MPHSSSAAGAWVLALAIAVPAAAQDSSTEASASEGHGHPISTEPPLESPTSLDFAWDVPPGGAWDLVLGAWLPRFEGKLRWGSSGTEFEANVRVLGSADTLNSSLEKAGRVADFFELAELMCRDALAREESCGGHFRVEYQTEDGEALRNDDEFAHVTAWEWSGDPSNPIEHREELRYESVQLATRSYK